MNKRIIAAAAAALMIFAGCSQNKPNTPQQTTETSAAETAMTPAMTNHPVEDPGEEEEEFSVYTGKVVENEADLAIFKISADCPEGFNVMQDDKEGKVWASEIGSMSIKAQNYKEEFVELEKFADQGCAGIKVNNMMYQADTIFGEPQKTTVAGFDAIRYDYEIIAYEFLYETNADGSQKTDEDGKPILTDEKREVGRYSDRVYFFYSDEDVFYIITESPKDKKADADPVFDKFIESVKVS